MKIWEKYLLCSVRPMKDIIYESRSVKNRRKYEGFGVSLNGCFYVSWRLYFTLASEECPFLACGTAREGAHTIFCSCRVLLYNSCSADLTTVLGIVLYKHTLLV